MTPLISVVIPSFNSAFIKECVDSVLSQTFEEFELLIVDCSTNDASIKDIEDLNHPKIRVFRRPERHLPGSNRNFGIERASGEFVICLDADDIIEPTFLEEALFVICCVNYDLVGTSIRTIGVMKKTIKLYAHPTLEQVAGGDAFVVTILMRKKLWRKLGGFADTAIGWDHIPEDWDFFLRALASGASLYNRGSYGFHYRKHYDSLTAQPDMPSREEMTRRIMARHGTTVSRQDSKADTPIIRKNGWKRLSANRRERTSRLLLLPEQINQEFVDRLTNSLAYSNDELIVVSTCQMETYPAAFLDLMSGLNALLFSLPDFLEYRELWFPFLTYLSESRNVSDIWYGQNPHFLDELSAITKRFPHSSFHYISRYSARPVCVKQD